MTYPLDTDMRTLELPKLRYPDYAGDTAYWENSYGSVKYTMECWHDEDASINDYDSMGRVSDYFTYRDDRSPRPDGFTGRALKIDADRSGFVWWEPYDGEYGYTDENGEYQVCKWEQLPPNEQHREKMWATRLIQEGFVGITVSRHERCNMGHYHVTQTASLGGIDGLENGYGAEVVADLIHEVNSEFAST